MQQQRPAERSRARHKPPMRVTTASAERKGVKPATRPAAGPAAGACTAGCGDKAAERSGKPSPPLPLPLGCGTRGEPACARRQLQPLPGMRGVALPAHAPDQFAVRAAPPRARRLRPAAPRLAPATPGLCWVPANPGAGAQSPAQDASLLCIAHCCGRGQSRALCSEQPTERRQVWAPLGDLLDFCWVFLSLCWPSS